MKVSRPIIQISADPTVTLHRADNAALRAAFAREHIPEDRPKIAFCLRNWSDFSQPAVIAEVADYAWERYGFLPVFIPVELPHDVMAAERTIAFMSAPYHVCRQRYTVEELISMLGSMQMVVGMRLHSLIFATLGQAPVIGLSYDVKVDSFIHDIGSTACVPIRDIDKEKIIHFIDEIAAGGCARTRVGLERLQQGEAINIAAARKLLEL